MAETTDVYSTALEGEAAPKWTPPEGSWPCPSCRNINFPTRTYCNRCHTPCPAMGGFYAARAASTPARGAQGTTAGGKWTPPAGSWSCLSCRNSNFPERVVCNRCQAPRGPEHMVMPMTMPMVPASGSKPRFTPPVGSWECPDAACANVNFPNRTACNRCQTPQPGSGSVAPPPPGKLQPGSWLCPNSRCNNVNFPGREKCNRCNALPAPQESAGFAMQSPVNYSQQSYMQQAPLAMPALPKPKWQPPAGSWVCTKCTNVNFPTRTTCNRCQTPKEADAASAGPGAGRYTPY